jgi:hypothetical protein
VGGWQAQIKEIQEGFIDQGAFYMGMSAVNMVEIEVTHR